MFLYFIRVLKNEGTMKNEEWVVIKNFENYMISNHGRIRNSKHERLVKTSKTKQGAIKVCLYSENIRETKSVKILVAENFLPGKTDQFDTPIHLDGNQSNNNVDNLMWRPRWFAWKYRRQFEYFEQYNKIGPIVDSRSKEVYLSIAEAGITNGLLFKEINYSLLNLVAVFPTWQQFEWE